MCTVCSTTLALSPAPQLANASIGFYEIVKAGDAVAALKVSSTSATPLTVLTLFLLTAPTPTPFPTTRTHPILPHTIPEGLSQALRDRQAGRQVADAQRHPGGPGRPGAAGQWERGAGRLPDQ